MTQTPAHSVDRLRSDFWDDAQPVQAASARTGGPCFADAHHWDLSTAEANPAAGRRSSRIRFHRLPGEWNLRGRELAMALLNPNHPTLRAQGIHLQSHPMSGKTINTILEGMATFAQWYDTELPGTSLRDVSQGDLDRFLAVLDQGATQNTRVCAVGAIRYLHRLRTVLTGGGITVPPWGTISTRALARRKTSPELSTPVVEPKVWWPLLRACWQYIDVFSHDILAAQAEWEALNRPSEQPQRLTHADDLIAAWIADPASRVPIHRMTYGRFRAGEIHWALLALLVSNGHSATIFTSPQNVAERRQSQIRSLLAGGGLKSTPGGLRTQPTSVQRLDGSFGPWISGFDPATIREQLAVLRTACYIFTAALTMMRDSELLSIPKNSVSTFHGTPAVTSFVYKKRRHREQRQWWIIEPVAQAIAVAESLSEHDHVFASIRVSGERFDRRDQLSMFLKRIEQLGPDAGLALIPPTHLSPHMFRRTMAVLTAQQPDGEIALGIQLKHATRRALANVTTTGYGASTPAWAREFEYETQDATAAKLASLWTQSPESDGLQLAGGGAEQLRQGLRQAVNKAALPVHIGDERTLRNLLRDKFSSLRWGTINHCLGIADQALCLQGQPTEVAAQGPMPNRCQPSRCRNSVITQDHAPIWLAEEADLKRHLADRRLAKHTRAQLQSELDDVQQITRRFTA